MVMTNDKFKVVEAMLYNYYKNKAEVKNMKLDLEVLENDYRGVGSITYEERTQATNAFSSSVENEVLKRDEKIILLRRKIRLKEIEIEKVDNIFNSLTKDETFIIQERYFNHNTNKYIAATLNVTEQTACSYKEKLINKITPLMFSE
jgi:RinA family phage transcriptional activator